ncbi:MAG: ribonuclease P protein component [Candidatus Yanofskybacteria bacterium]|nr:ribonuclease P protein component [Candidatus Yanofskybacteria bacterium]
MALPRPYRLKKETDFKHVFKRGKTVRGSFLFAKFIKSDLAHPRCGFVVSQRVAPKASKRNAIRRTLTETAQGYFTGIKRGYDIVIVVTKVPADLADLKGDLAAIFNKANL